MGFLTEAETIRYLDERTAGSELVLFTDPPTKVGTDGTEVVGGGYLRPAVPFAPATAGTFGQTGRVANDSGVTIPNMPVASTAVQGFGLADAATDEIWYVDPDWTPTKPFAAGEDFHADAGALVLYGEN